jgi:hypothetical protein
MRCSTYYRASDPPEVPVSRLFLRSEVSPGWSPFPVVSAFLRLIRWSAQEFAASILMIFWLSTCRPQNRHGYPRHRLFLHRLVHTFIHMWAQAGDRACGCLPRSVGPR